MESEGLYTLRLEVWARKDATQARIKYKNHPIPEGYLIVGPNLPSSSGGPPQNTTSDADQVLRMTCDGFILLATHVLGRA